MMNRLQSEVTKWYIKGRQVKDTVQLRLPNGISIEVIVFGNKKALSLAQTTIVGTIIAVESAFSKYSATARDYIFTHEYAHTKQECLRNAELCLVLMLILAPLIFMARAEWLLSLISCILATISLFILSWLMEFGAGFYALDNLGKDWVLQATKEIKNLSPPKRVSQLVVLRLTHPKIGLVISIYDFFQRFKRQF